MNCEHKKLASRGIALNVCVFERAGPPIVLLHGVTRTWRDWLTVAPVLRQFGTLQVLDQRGHGESERGSAYRVADYVEDAAAYVDGLGERVTVIGHSLGSMVAAGVAAARPDRVRALVLEDPTFEMTASRVEETWFADAFRAFLPHAGSGRPGAEIARELASTRVRGPGSVGFVPMGQLRDAASLRFTAECLKKLDPAVLSVIIERRWLEGYDVEATLRGIACPTLFLQGDFAVGGALPDDYARELGEMIRDCVFVKLPGLGHSIHSGAPHEFARLVVPFLSAVGV